jgi:sugar lactone lactonase YvrE
MPQTIPAELILDAQALLGEGPVWDARRQTLYWVDIMGCQVHAFQPAASHDRAFDVGQPVGTVVPRRSGGVMVALRDGFAALDTDTGELTLIADPEARLPQNRFNDGKCDPAGRFWAGTMRIAEDQKGAGSLYRLDPDLSVHKMWTNITVANGIAWSHDARTMYYIDTPTKMVVAFDYNVETGAIANPRPVVHTPDGPGFPDGMTIDAEGMLWVAYWDGWRVVRWDPATGRALATIELPVAKVTAPWFGGPNLDELYITSARIGLSEDALAKQPHAGSLFVARPGVAGLPAFEFAG